MVRNTTYGMKIYEGKNLEGDIKNLFLIAPTFLYCGSGNIRTFLLR